MSSDAVLDKIIEDITVARVSLLMKHPFFGSLATRLRIKEGGEWCNTAATDGVYIYFNRDFFQKLSIDNIKFVIGHEILHNVFDHFGRLNNRNRNIFNYAADFCVNYHLVGEKIGDHNVPEYPPLLDSRFDNMCAEEIYDLLKNKSDEMLKELGDLLDQHIDWERNPDSKSESEGGHPTYTTDELHEIRGELQEAIITAARTTDANKIPACITRFIKDLTEPQMDWKAILQRQIESILKADYSWVKPSRKAWHLNAILPGSKPQETIDICISVDMSGSISDEQAATFLGEVKGIMQQYQDFKIKIWCFDTSIHRVRDFDTYTVDEFEKYVPKGGGGTDFMVNWDFMKERDIVPKKLIMFTDGYPKSNEWGIPEYCDVIFIMHGTTSIVPPFGEYAYFTE